MQPGVCFVSIRGRRTDSRSGRRRSEVSFVFLRRSKTGWCCHIVGLAASDLRPATLSCSKFSHSQRGIYGMPYLSGQYKYVGRLAITEGYLGRVSLSPPRNHRRICRGFVNSSTCRIHQASKIMGTRSLLSSSAARARPSGFSKLQQDGEGAMGISHLAVQGQNSWIALRWPQVAVISGACVCGDRLL
ncbi:hypothetical protein BDV95DRAFT_275406 [Massariosphaeria phaeospora]|uniref:Uncharacterized protein n=1 Tax=Massariosphaeria phaeospora TaxID=100035 RepID=A0A7C8MRR5_9PLEO|nr:hypothetical protein BDV95DRAFT_275406 [Massariosphaeria phaeospora]